MTRAILALVLLAGCGSVEGRDGELRVGTCVVDITPPVGYRLGGYFKDRFAKEVRDPLYAKAIVFAQGSTRAAIVTADLVGVPAWIVDRVRARAEGQTGIPAAHIAIAGTHTHTGPYLPRQAVEDDPYLSTLLDQLVTAIHGAEFALAPARLSAGSLAPSPALSFNRRHLFKDGKIRTIGPVTRNLPDHEAQNIVRPAGPIDPDLDLVLVRDAARVAAVLSVFALHCNTVGDTTIGEEVVSADYPGFLERDLRKAFGPRVVSLFGAGTCGDINYVDPKAPGTRTSEQIGSQLARTVVAAEPTLRPVRPSLAVRRARFEAPLQRFPADKVEQAKKDVARPKEIPFYQLVEANSILDIDRKAGAPYPLEVQAFRLDAETAIACIPGEVFVELGLAIKKGSPFRTTIVIELANDNGPAYIPTKQAFVESGYEVLASRLASGGGERIVDETVKVLRELR